MDLVPSQGIRQNESGERVGYNTMVYSESEVRCQPLEVHARCRMTVAAHRLPSDREAERVPFGRAWEEFAVTST